MTCECRKNARCADCMERDALSRTPDSPAFYEERIRLLKADNKQLRDALEAILGNRSETTIWTRIVARAALDDAK